MNSAGGWVTGLLGAAAGLPRTRRCGPRTAVANAGNGGSAVVAQPAPQGEVVIPSPHARPDAPAAPSAWPRWSALAVVAVALLSIAGHLYLRPAHALTESDSHVLADIPHSTSQPVFDNTLRQALAGKLIDSPFLNILPDHRIPETLRFMGPAPARRLPNPAPRERGPRLAPKANATGPTPPLPR